MGTTWGLAYKEVKMVYIDYPDDPDCDNYSNNTEAPATP